MWSSALALARRVRPTPSPFNALIFNALNWSLKMSDLAILGLRYGGIACGMMTIIIAACILLYLRAELKQCRYKHDYRRLWSEVCWTVGYAGLFLTASTVALIASF